MIKDTLIGLVQGQMTNLQCVDTKELGEVIDMIKDLEEAQYYCTVVEAMEANGDKQARWTDQSSGRLYYQEMGGGNNSSGGRSYYQEMGGRDYEDYYPNDSSGSRIRGGRPDMWERDFSMELRDEREGKSPIRRKMYMESKETHQEKDKVIRELEKYMDELTNDIMEIVKNATPEEKTLMQRKLQTLGNMK